jgi:hypothetical protein
MHVLISSAGTAEGSYVLTVTEITKPCVSQATQSNLYISQTMFAFGEFSVGCITWNQLPYLI